MAMMHTPIALQMMEQALCTGPVVLLRPGLALEFGVLQALVFSQIAYRATGGNWSQDCEPVRVSYTRLQQQLPFYTRRWLIKAVQRLEERGAIKVSRTGRINVFTINGKYDFGTEMTQSNSAAMLVFPELACKVGVLEAVALQQVHLRVCWSDGSDWAVKSITQWRATVFPYLGIATVKRLFARLRRRDLIYVRKCDGDGIPVYGYRVNYVRLAHVLGVPLPSHPEVKDGQIHPFYPLGNVQSSPELAESGGAPEIEVTCAA